MILSIDIGTSAVKTGLYEHQGRLVRGSLSRAPVELVTMPGGAAELDTDMILERVYSSIDRTLSLADNEIEAVACCTLASNILGVSRDGAPATPVYTYADSRAEEDALWLRENTDPQAVHQRTGCVIHSSYLPARFLWLNRLSPQVFTRAVRWMSLGEYLQWKLLGVQGASYSIASWSGLLNRHRLEWDAELLELLPVGEEQLSPLVDIDQSWSGLLEPFASRWPALRRCPWFPAVGDGAAANIGSGCVLPAKLALTMGSTTALRLVVPPGVVDIPPGLWSYFVDREHALLGGALSEGGNIHAWLRQTLQIEAGEAFDAQWAAMLPDRHGLTFLPLLAGERSPGWCGDARGVIAGLSLSTRPAEIYRAALEGVALRIGLVYRLLKPYLNDDHQVIANGGALVSSPQWVQIIADVLGHPITLSAVEETSLRGGALLALHTLGMAKGLDAFPPVSGREFKPDPIPHEIYRQAVERQQRLYDLND
jgi:gluconokinase